MRAVFLLLIFAASGAAVAQSDVTRPARVEGLLATHNGTDVDIVWQPVTLDAAGQPETIDHYKVYRGDTPDFIPDRIGGTNLVGTVLTEAFIDLDAAADANDYFYLVGAVDTAGNESNTKHSLITTRPTVSGFWTNNSVEIDWTDAEPTAEVVSYNVYWGKASGEYEFVTNVGLDTTFSLTGAELFVNWYLAVTGVDANGNEGAFSNEHIDPIRGLVRLRAQDGEELCWGGDCVTNPGSIHRAGGFQVLTPVFFPEGEWTSVKVTYTMESRLCTPPNQGTTSKCGTGNPCPTPPCNGGYNPCGDPWDRLSYLFLVLDDCIDAGGSCITPENLELMRAITPFGTDAVPPNGTGFVPPRALTLDITPYAPLLTGDRWIGAHIGHFVQKGHWVTVDFEFSKRPDQASPKPPADGIQVLGYGNAPWSTQATVPPTATDVKIRVFTTGHGGGLHCDGGSNNAMPCSSSAQCPGGVCNPCDEFCHRTNRIVRDGTPVWTWVPWRTDCTGNPACNTWNACGFPSCTFPRSGWCPGYIACHHNDPCDQDLDMTVNFPPGGTYDVDYTIEPQNGSWPVSMVMYWYE